MTKEELEKEAEEWIIKNSREFITNPNYSPFDYAEAIYLASAEPREKRIAELEAIVRNTKAVDESFAKLQLKNTELKAQIEKMKSALNKIIKTVHNDNISGYGDRLVIIYDISCEVLQEIEK